MRKTKKAASSRIRIRKSGGLKRYKPGARHLMTGKSATRQRRLRKSISVASVDLQRMRRLIPHG